MTTITIQEDFGCNQTSFANVAELLSYLEKHGILISLQELSLASCPPELQQRAREAGGQYERDPSSFSDL